MHELGFENYINAGQSSVSVLLLQQYRELGLTDQELLVFLQTKAMLDQGATEPNTTQIGEYMGLSAKTVFSVLESIRSKGLIQFETTHDADGKLRTIFRMQPLYEKLITLPDGDSKRAGAEDDTPKVNDEPKRADIFKLVEQEFGRMLSPIEMRKVTDWFDLDHFEPVLIVEAIKEAVLNQALNLNYIEKILLNWRKLNFKSAQDVRTNQQRRRNLAINQNDAQQVHVPLNVDLLSLQLPENKG